MEMAKHSLRALSRAFMRVSGSDAERFLNGMWTADIKGAARGFPRKAGGYALLLDAKGKLISDAEFLAENGAFLFSINSLYSEACLAQLDRLIIADDVQLELLTAENSPFDRVIEVPNSPFVKNDVAELRVAPLSPSAKDRVYFVEEEEWGVRVPKGILGPRHEEWWIKKSKKFPGEDSGNLHWLSDDEWKALRVASGAAEMGKDFGPDALPLEFPLLNAISFHKGCYIGQEVIARATYRGKMVRAWVRVEADGNLEENALLYSELEPERAIGKLTTCLGNKGLGLARVSVFETPQKLFQKKADQSVVNITRMEDLSETAKES